MLISRCIQYIIKYTAMSRTRLFLISTILISEANMKNLSLYENVPPQRNNFTVSFKEYIGQSTLLPHWHEHLELLYFLDGECELVVGGKQLRACRGDLVVVNATEVHSFVASEKIRYYCTLIYPDFFGDIEFRGIRIKNLIRDDVTVSECFENMCVENDVGGVCGEMMLKSHTYRLIAYLADNFTEHTARTDEIKRNCAQLDRLTGIIDYVASHYRERISTADLAALCFLTESHFCRFFKKMTGESAINYINGYRIERAAILLSETDDSISDIAECVGFDDTNYFTRVFKKCKGLTPQAWRGR